MKGESAEGQAKKLRAVVYQSLMDTGHVRSRARAKEMACELEIEMICRGAKVESEAQARAPAAACEISRLRAVVFRSLVDTRHASHDQAVAMADDIALAMFQRGAAIDFAAMAG